MINVISANWNRKPFTMSISIVTRDVQFLWKEYEY